MKQITRGKVNEKIEKALDKAVPSWYDYYFTIEIIGDIFFVDLTALTPDTKYGVQVFMDINRFDARKAVKVEIA